MKWTYLVLLGLAACQSRTTEEAKPSPATPIETISKPAIRKIPAVSDLTLTVDNLKLREKPGSDGKELMRLPENSVVTPTGEMTDLKQQVSLRGLSYNEPWLEVKVNENVQGWIFGGAVDLDPESSELSKKLFETRFVRFFGSSSGQLEDYREAFRQANSAAALHKVFEEGMALESSVTKAFSRRSRVAEMPMEATWGWVDKSFPGFALVRVAEATEVAFLPNINQFLEAAAKTPEKDDDKAFEFLKSLNGNYSILLAFREWYMQTTDYGGVSLLGTGKHLKYLTEAEALYKEGNVFVEGLIKRECNLMVEDIVNNVAGYARNKTEVLGEIDQIIAADFEILSPMQKTSIENRKKQFDNPEANKIKVDEKIGVQ